MIQNLRALLGENLPLGLTLLRLASPFIICPLLFLDGAGWAWLAAILFTASALTDWLDGVLARRSGSTTYWGQVLDPIADKILVLLTLLGLAAAQSLGPWALTFTFLLFFRELTYAALRQGLADQHIEMPVSALSKGKSFLTYVACGFLILGGSLQPLGSLVLGLALIPAYVSATLSLRKALTS